MRLHLDGWDVEVFEVAETRCVSPRRLHQLGLQALQILLYQPRLKHRHTSNAWTLCVWFMLALFTLEAALPSRCRPGGLQQEWTEPKWLLGNPDRSLLPSPGPKPWNTWRTQTSSRQADNLFLNPISVLTSQKQVSVAFSTHEGFGLQQGCGFKHPAGL